MLLHLILGAAALLAVMFAGGLLVAIIGIRRGDRRRRLYGRPADPSEAFARRLLAAGSRDCTTDYPAKRTPDGKGGRSMSRMTDLAAAVVTTRRHRNELDCEKSKIQLASVRATDPTCSWVPSGPACLDMREHPSKELRLCRRGV